MSPTQRAQPEHWEQAALFDWAAKHEARIPELRGLFAVPNGTYKNKATAGKFKREGLKAGVLDVWWPVPREGYHGLVIEMKAPGELKRTTVEQDWWINFLLLQGFDVRVFDNWRRAWNHMMAYAGRSDLQIPVI